MAYKHRKYPEWSWSLSRDNIFNTCLKKYYYQYYKSHNGWEWDATLECKKAYRLKKLQSLDIILGNSVHQVIDQLINNDLSLKRKTIEKILKKNLNDAFRSSKNKPAWELNPSKHIMLKDIYYNGKLKQNKIEKIKYKIDRIINYLINTEIIDKIKNSNFKKSFPPGTFESINYNDTKVYAIPDLIYKENQKGTPVIIDWKTGKEKNSETNQLKVYAYYYYTLYDYNKEIDAYFIYLFEQKEEKYTFDTNIIDQVEDMIDHSLEKMKNYLKDEKWNMPAEEEQFKRRTNDIVCSYCRYRELCDR